jgi:thymidylate kinase
MTIVARPPDLPIDPIPDDAACLGAALAPSQEGPAPAKVFRALLAGFERERVSYCYWKSARRVQLSLAGQSDLDLLVSRRDRPRAAAVLERHGFKLWPDAPGLDHPALVSLLCYDEESGAILHVHVHFRLVLGHALMKSFRLPIEERILSRSAMHASLPIRILDPADEALLVIVRANLDMRGDDPLALRRWRALEKKYSEDCAFLLDWTDVASVRASAEEIFSPALAEAIASRLHADSPRNYGLRRAITRELSPFRGCGRAEGMLRGALRSVRLAASALHRRALGGSRLPRRRAPGGGVIIAFAGVDGSGKSTQVAQTRKWLGAEIDVLPLYFGSGDGAPSMLFRPFKVAARLVARTVRVKPKGASHGKVSDRPPGPLYSVLFAIWAIAVALDKRRKLSGAQRAVARGIVVVADRYPQNENAQFNDGPLLHRLEWAPQWLRRFETSIYASAQHAPPDLVVRLRVGPEAVARREPEMRHDVILRRVAWLDELTFGGAHIVTVDGAQPLAEVTRIARRAVWDVL